MVIAHHIVLTGYGHWLPNDPRGSMSLKTYAPELAALAETHFGRREHQPSLAELKAFYRKAAPVLAHPILWFNRPHRAALVDAMREAVRRERLTCYACAVLSNHVHVLVRRHRLEGREILVSLKDELHRAIRDANLAPPGHPVFSEDSCVVFKNDPRAIRTCVQYINDNVPKHGQARVLYDFVQPYDGWPHREG